MLFWLGCVAVDTGLPNIWHKITTFEHLNKTLVLVVQDHLLGYMKREFDFAHLNAARSSDPMHFHSYRMSSTAAGHKIELHERFSTDTPGISVCLGLKADAIVELEQFVLAIQD